LKWLFINRDVGRRQNGVRFSRKKIVENGLQLAQLIHRAQNNNSGTELGERAFAEIIQRFHNAALHWAKTVLGDGELAQDAVQEASLVAFRKLGQLRQPQAFSTWFKLIVVSQCHRILRQRRFPTASLSSTLDFPDLERDPAQTVESEELKADVLTAVQALSEKEQIVTKMFYLKGYSQKEIARLLELPLTTVKKRLQYARKNLKIILVAMADSLVPAPDPFPAPIPIPVQSDPRE
jgi:RNA polymerase sigma factor (sigma-70 family)